MFVIISLSVQSANSFSNFLQILHHPSLPRNKFKKDFTSPSKNHPFQLKMIYYSVQVKTDMVLLMAKKRESGKKWTYVTEQEKKAKEPKK